MVSCPHRPRAGPGQASLQIRERCRMNQAFADTSYWIALLNPRDELHRLAQSVSTTLAGARIVTSEWILAELLNSFADHGTRIRMIASSAVATLLQDPSIAVVPQSEFRFELAFQ